jgi:DNA-binding SARP family transcriptional activator
VAERGRGPLLTRAADVAGALVTAVLAFTAVPAVLLFVVGNPLRAGAGHGWSLLSCDALCVLTVAAWVAWAACCAQILRSVMARVRRGEVGTRPGSLVDWLARRIAMGVLAVTSVGAPVTLSSASGAVPPQAHAAALIVAHGAIGDPRTPRHSARTAYTVRPGDTLWSVADAHLGDGAQWTAVAALNRGSPVSPSERLVDPDHLREGWRLELPREAEHPSAHDRQTAHPQATGRPDHLPELLVLGLGSLTCAALARRSRRRFRIPPFVDPLDSSLLPSERAVDTATLLHRFDGVPALRSFETANRLLGLAVLEEGRPGPKVRLVQVGPTGVTFHFLAPERQAPEPLRSVDGGRAWHVNHNTLENAIDPCDPYLPLAFPVGDDDEGTWLMAPGPGDVVPLLGEGAPDLQRAARAAAESWAWSDEVVVTDDPQDPRLVERAVGHRLFLGRPDLLAVDVAAHTAVLTTETAVASDLTVLVDRHGASLHPVGRVIRPHLLSAATEEDVAELVAPISPAAIPHEDLGSTVHGLAAVAADEATLAPGSVDVRLLTMTPRLDGLAEPLPPNRVRRAVELVAYLALHAPDVVTGDRLRTRVLGSTDADAASKTLFNVAHAARRALGTDADGNPLFPSGTRAGIYQLSPDVTVDVQRAIAFVAAAKTHDDRDLAIALYRAALDLVEGEPLANALSGYAWWETEGHGGRIAAVLATAACSMAALATDAGLFELAQWGLERARLVEPYSEALSRTAMEVAAAQGDADRLRLEWRECQRLVDALDPGSSPSPRTEELFGELSRRVLTGPGRPVRQRVGSG